MCKRLHFLRGRWWRGAHRRGRQVYQTSINMAISKFLQLLQVLAVLSSWRTRWCSHGRRPKQGAPLKFPVAPSHGSRSSCIRSKLHFHHEAHLAILTRISVAAPRSPHPHREGWQYWSAVMKEWVGCGASLPRTHTSMCTCALLITTFLSYLSSFISFSIFCICSR